MKFKAFEKLLTVALLVLMGFYLFSSLPIWATLVLAGLMVFSFILLVSDLGCSMIFIFPAILIINFVLAGIIKIEFFTSVMFTLVATALIMIFVSSGLSSVFSLIFLGVYLSLAKPHGTVADLLFFGFLLGTWYLNKSKLLNLKIALVYILSILIVATVFSRIDFVPLKPILSLIPAHQEQQTQKEQQEEQVILMQPSERSQNSKKSFLTDFIDKIWFPAVLILFGSLLFTFSISNFGVRGTLKLLMLGILTFTIAICSLSLFFRFIKPSENTIQETFQYEEKTGQSQQFYQPSSTATIVIENSQTKQSKMNVTLILDIISMLALLLMIITLIYSLLKGLRLKTYHEQNAEGNIPKDIELYPIEVIPEYEPSEKFILGAYWWLRRKYFAQYHHLTPIEILKIAENQENLSVATDVYVRLRYARKNLSEQEMKLFYENMIAFVQERQSKIDQSEDKTVSNIDVKELSDKKTYEK
ncbi:hypothetical protein [Thermotoga profunda]|uniref:hypothetical protein n=1 Tax=Thermotoga profunda TaxID=1508420 RepID=UPI0005979907|nr:hypothetical protein [Thermotoga profunda]